MKRTLIAILSILLFFLVLTISPIRKVEAVTITVTRTFTSSVYDGLAYDSDATFGTARNNSVADLSRMDGTTETFGVDNQTLMLGFYRVARLYLYFNTSLIPDDANITGLTLRVRYQGVVQDDSDFNVTVWDGQPTYPSLPLVDSDYDFSKYPTKIGEENTTAWTGTNYANITLANASLTATGWTRFCLKIHMDDLNISPSGTNYVTISMAENGESKAPRLYVDYDAEGYRYIVYGPYYENGDNYPGIVNMTLSRENEELYSFVLDGAGGPDNVTIEIEQQGIAFVWNVSGGVLNKTRTYSLPNSTFHELFIFIPDLNIPFYTYTFTITDFTGVTNGFIETIINVNGTDRILERQSISVVNVLPFWMSWGHTYTLRLICDQGTYTWGDFIALSETGYNLPITADMFPFQYSGENVTCSATRMNGTWIQIVFVDGKSRTSWVKCDIKYKSGVTWVSSYSINNSGNSHVVNWYSAVESTDYRVDVTAQRTGGQNIYYFSCASPAASSNPFAGALSILGDWPFDEDNAFALFAVISSFAVVSYIHSEVGLAVGIFLAAFFVYLGLLAVSWSLIALAFAVLFFSIIKTRKREEPPTH